MKRKQQYQKIIKYVIYIKTNQKNYVFFNTKSNDINCNMTIVTIHSKQSLNWN